MMGIKLYAADCRGVESNCSYLREIVITDEVSLRSAVNHDYVCVAYKSGYRSNANFMASTCLGLDCDNDHSDDPNEWITPEHVRGKFPDATFAIHYSRHNKIPKRGKAPRPKFHVLFLIDELIDREEYSDLKRRVNAVFPFFDTKAMDAARFFFGTENPEVAYYPGTITLNDCLDMYYPNSEEIGDWDADMPSGGAIPEGSRNSTLSHFAGRVLKRFGDTDEAYEAFTRRAAQCDPPLDDVELKTIWRSAQGFFQRISKQDSYIPPEQWNAEHPSGFTYDPDDRTDVGQARLLGRHFSQELRYSPATDYIRYDGSCWQETKPGAQAVAHALTDLQLEESENAVVAALEQLTATGAKMLLDRNTKKKAEEMMNDQQRAAYAAFLVADGYRAFALKRRESKNVTATLKEARPVLEIEPGVLDKDWFLLCTPEATYDLRQGVEGAREHHPDDYITKMTTCTPSDRGAEIWRDALNTFFCDDQALIQYVQRVAGIVCVGQVFLEAMIIAYGDGRNGKSTFWNTLSRVMGSYSGNISADSLTMNCKRNVKPEMAETKGKRLLIAAELEEGTRLNTSIVKQLCSTDAVFAEKKYKDPFSFTPSHTLVLYTNHLPKVGAKDAGIWRRLIVIPFKAKIEGKNDVKNYTEYLCENAGEAIMKWMIDGARQVIELGFKIPFPKCVSDAIEEYKAENDWLGHFLGERCEIGDGLTEKSGELYSAYRVFSSLNGEYVRSTTDFYAALETEGFIKQRTRSERLIVGLRLIPFNNDAGDDFQDFLR
jgi:putative DNA primase/helicase